MKVLRDGHRYELDNFEEPRGSFNQVIQFIEKDLVGPQLLETTRNGTTNEEVLRVLIHRLRFLGQKLPSRENSIAITKLEEALLWLEKRTADRAARGVEGTREP